MSVKIQEPTQDNNGGIYLWVDAGNWQETEFYNTFNPQYLLMYTSDRKPRAYVIPYTREMHKKIANAMRKKKGTKGGIMVVDGKKKGKMGNGESMYRTEPVNFKILNPADLMPKED